MSERVKMSTEEVRAILYEIWGPPRPKPKPKVVTSDGEIVRDALCAGWPGRS